MTAPILELCGVVKDYRSLRPLRIERLTLDPGEQLAIIGLNEVAAQVFINLVTGAVLPDAGEIQAFGRSTGTIEEGSQWLAIVDRFGIISQRAVLLNAFSVLQNLAVPFSLDIDPPPAEIVERAAALADEVGIDPSVRHRRVADLDAASRAQVRLGRAVALDPAVLLLEHPSAGLRRADVAPLERRVRAVAVARNAASLTLTGDPEFADLVASRVLTLELATGKLEERRRHWLRR